MAPRDSLRAMLEARSVAIVGASARVGSFGHRMVAEALRSTAPLDVHLINPRYTEIDDRPCLPSLAALDAPVDLVLLGVPDSALEAQVELAAARGDRGAVVFGSVVGDAARAGDGAGDQAGARDEQPISLRHRIARLAGDAGMALCGGGCMGFVNVAHGLRAVGYVEAATLPAGPVALVSHSGSAFSALLRTHRRIGYSLAVSSGQELVTAAADYLHYALDQPGTGVVALLLETMRRPDVLRAGLARAAAAGVPVVALTVGSSAPGAAMVAAHSGALAGGDGAWEALFDAYGVLRVRDLDELADTLELFAAGRRAAPGTAGIATVHDSGAERAMVVDLADELGAPFARLSAETVTRLSGLLDPGLVPDNPLDVWGTGADTRGLFGSSLTALAADPAVGVVALAVDLVHEYDGDDGYPRAVEDAWAADPTPMAVLSPLHSSLDQELADGLRRQGIPVLEGARSGLVALRHLASYGVGPQAAPATPAPVDEVRQARWRSRLAGPALTGAESFDLLADYGLPTVGVAAAASRDDAVAAAEALGWPVVLKTDEPGIDHKSDVGGVVLGLADPGAVGKAYDDLAARLGPRVLVCATAPAGVEMALGVVRDPLLGPLVLLAAGGVLVELASDRAVALPPVSAATAERALGRLKVRHLLAGHRGAAPADVGAVLRAVVALSDLAVELGPGLAALDVNPVIVTGAGLFAVDALVVPAR